MNPAGVMSSSFLQFISGVIEFHEELPTSYLFSEDLESSRHSSYAILNQQPSASNKFDGVVSGTKVCLVMLPSHMIPCDILRYFTKPYLDKILSMQILRHIAPHVDKYLALIELDNEDSANELISDFNGQPLCALEEVQCILYSVKSVQLSTADDRNSQVEYDHRDSTAGIHRTTSSGSISLEHSSSVGRFLSLSPTSSTQKQSVRSLSLSPASSSIPLSLDYLSGAVDEKGSLSACVEDKGTLKVTGDVDTSPTALIPIVGIEVGSPGNLGENICLSLRGVSFGSINEVTGFSPTVVSVTAPATTSVILTHDKNIDSDEDDFIHRPRRERGEAEIEGEGEEYICPVCLEPISSSKPFSFTTACRHTYHIDCISKLEGPQCPVCR